MLYAFYKFSWGWENKEKKGSFRKKILMPHRWHMGLRDFWSNDCENPVSMVRGYCDDV